MDVSVVICTHNRSRLLRSALTHLTAVDRGSLRCELVVVDNNSDDDTAEVVRECARVSPIDVRYAFEPAQGISHARNRGWGLARGSIVAFTDDDVCVCQDWLTEIARTFARNTEVDCVGGKVLPEWPIPPPAWLTRDHWAPLAILDYGDAPLYLDRDDARCLIGANVAFRHDVFARIGGFSPSVQRVKEGIGSIEDHEFLGRLWDSGGRALYAPGIVVVAPVDPPRLEKGYHRRWHHGHGHFHAVMSEMKGDRSSAGRGLGVPAWQYRQCLGNGTAWLSHVMRGQLSEAFLYETRLRFFWGFFQTRRRAYVSHTLASLRTGRNGTSTGDQPTRVP